MKATRIAVLTLFLGVSGHAAAQNLYRPYHVITPHRAAASHQITGVRQIKSLKPQINVHMPIPHLYMRPCPAGWRLVSGKAAGAYTCKRATAPRCATGYRLKRGACKNPGGGIDLSGEGPGQCTYQCIPEAPRFKPKCAKGFHPRVGACEVGCKENITIY
jgi:hypothetical protein